MLQVLVRPGWGGRTTGPHGFQTAPALAQFMHLGKPITGTTACLVHFHFIQ